MAARRLIAKQAREWPEKLANDMTAFRANRLSTLQVDRLSNLSDDLGIITSGEFRVGNGVEPDSGFTGGRMAWPEMTYGGSNFFLVGVENDVLQIGLGLDTGKLHAGGGKVVIDSEGIKIKAENNAHLEWESDGHPSAIRLIASTADDLDRLSLQVNVLGDAGSGRIEFRVGNTTTFTFNHDGTDGAVEGYATFNTTTGLRVGSLLKPTAMLDVVGGIKSSGSIATNDNINASGTFNVSEALTVGTSRVMTQASAFLNFQQSGTLVISSASITVKGSRHRVDGSGAATQTDLERINGLTDGDLIMLRTVNNDRDVKLRHNTTGGNLHLSNNADRILNNITDMFVGIFNSNTNKVVEWGKI